MQINNNTFEKFITVNLVSGVCSYCSVSRLLTFMGGFCAFLSSFLQDCEADMKYFVVMDIYFFIYNVHGGETFILSEA